MPYEGLCHRQFEGTLRNDSVTLYLSVSVSLSPSLSLFLSVCLCIPFSLSISPSLFLSFSLSESLSVYLPLYLCISLSLSLYFFRQNSILFLRLVVIRLSWNKSILFALVSAEILFWISSFFWWLIHKKFISQE